MCILKNHSVNYTLALLTVATNIRSPKVIRSPPLVLFDIARWLDTLEEQTSLGKAVTIVYRRTLIQINETTSSHNYI